MKCMGSADKHLSELKTVQDGLIKRAKQQEQLYGVRLKELQERQDELQRQANATQVRPTPKPKAKPKTNRYLGEFELLS